MPFYDSYSNLLSQLPPSLIKAGWIRLTTRKRNPLTESEASNISPIIEAFLKHEVDRYQRKKKYRYNPTHHIQNIDSKDHIQLPSYHITTSINSEDKEVPSITYNEDEFNTRLKEENEALRQKLIETI